MKKSIIISAILALAIKSFALDYTYSTNLFYALTYPTNIYMGTNASDGATNGDTFYSWGTKINAEMNLSQQRFLNQAATNANVYSNLFGAVPAKIYLDGERFGEVAVANLGVTTTVTFSTPYPVGGTNYSVLLTTSGFSTFPSAMYSAKTTNGFTINTAAIAGGGLVSYFTKR